jgi:hypothetical protein
MAVDRQTVDLSAYPDLVVIYLGMRVRRPRGMLRLFRTGSQIEKSWKQQPDGLLLHEDITWSLIPPTSVCASTGATLTAWNGGPGLNRTSFGGSNSSKTLVESAFGTRPTS